MTSYLSALANAYAELRQFEWSQRMRARRRNVLRDVCNLTIGTTLWARAATGGAQALAQPVGALEAGRRADLLVLNLADPALAGQAADDVLDAAIFGPARAPVRDVMAGGKWIVRDGRHQAEEEIFARYSAALARMDASR